MALQELIFVQMNKEMIKQGIPESVANTILQQIRSLDRRDWNTSSWANAQAVIVSLMEVIESCAQLPGPQKKQLVLSLLQCIDPQMNASDASALMDILVAASKGLVAINQSCCAKGMSCFS